jgi:hypothetical protein
MEFKLAERNLEQEIMVVFERRETYPYSVIKSDEG